MRARQMTYPVGQRGRSTHVGFLFCFVLFFVCLVLFCFGLFLFCLVFLFVFFFCFVFFVFFGGVLFVSCLTSQQHASVSQGRICSDNFTCCHTEMEVTDQTFHLTQSQYTDTGPTSPSTDPITPGAWQGSHWSANFEVTGMTRPRQIPSHAGFEPRIFRSVGGHLNH